MVNVPVGTDTPAATVADGSFINSIQAAQWYWVNPTGTIWNDPSVLFTTDQLDHGTAQSLDIVSGYGTLENQFEYSEALTTSPWDTVGGRTTTANAANNPFGGSNANLLTEDTSTGGHYVYQFVTLAGGVYEFSVYAKSNGDGILIQPLSGGPYAGFNLSTGTVCTQGAGGVGINSGHWWRMVPRQLAHRFAGFWLPRVSIFTTNGSCTNNYTGNGTSGAYLWGHNLNTGLTLFAYIKTTGSVFSLTEHLLYGQGTVFSNVNIGANTVLPSILTGYHGNGSGDVKVQLSDGTGTASHAAIFDANGGLTNGIVIPERASGYGHFRFRHYDDGAYFLNRFYRHSELHGKSVFEHWGVVLLYSSEYDFDRDNHVHNEWCADFLNAVCWCGWGVVRHLNTEEANGGRNWLISAQESTIQLSSSNFTPPTLSGFKDIEKTLDAQDKVLRQIVENTSGLQDLKDTVKKMDEERNKVKGAAKIAIWLGGTGLLGEVGRWIFFRK